MTFSLLFHLSLMLIKTRGSHRQGVKGPSEFPLAEGRPSNNQQFVCLPRLLIPLLPFVRRWWRHPPSSALLKRPIRSKLGALAGWLCWCIVPYTTRLQVQFPVRAQT